MFSNFNINVRSNGMDAARISEDFAWWIMRNDMNQLFEGCYNRKQVCDLICSLYSVRLKRVGMYVEHVHIEWNERLIELLVLNR